MELILIILIIMITLPAVIRFFKPIVSVPVAIFIFIFSSVLVLISIILQQIFHRSPQNP